MRVLKRQQLDTLFGKNRAQAPMHKRRAKLNKESIATVGICGVGLIGGSIAERLRSVSPKTRIVGHDRQRVLTEALRQSVIDERLKPADMLQACDLIVLSANPSANQSLLRLLGRQKSPSSALITDTGSTQCGIAKLNETLEWKNNATFVAGHPMAGREVQGLANRFTNLFCDHPFFFDESAPLSQKQRDLLDWFTGKLGSYSLYVANERHDAVMTDISQIPQLLSTVMSAFVSHYDKQTIHLAGTGLKSMIRLGGSPYSNWRDVFAENSGRLGASLDVLIEELKAVRAKIDAEDSLRESFQKAKRSYSCLW